MTAEERREISDILSDLTYWDTCPEAIKQRIPILLKSLTPPDAVEEKKTALHFAEWIDIQGIRWGRYEWKYKADNYKNKFSTEEMFQKWKSILTSL